MSPSDAGRMTLYRATAANNYSCSPRCERTPMPGEPNSTYDVYAGPYSAYQGRATGGGQASGGGAPAQ